MHLFTLIIYLHCVFDSDGGHEKSDVSSSSYVWLRPHLRVRIIDQSYRRGKYYKMKVLFSELSLF